MKIQSPPPPNKEPRPFPTDTTIEQQGEMFRIVRRLSPDFTIEGLEKLVESGLIQSYSRQGDEFVIFTQDAAMMDQIARLPKSKLPNPWVEKAKEIFLPPNMDENVASEYLRFRGWALGASMMNNAISYANLSVGLEASHIALGTTEKIVLAQTINTYAWRLTSMGASFLGQKGDKDPRRYYTINQLISMSNNMATLGVLSVLPVSYPYLGFATSLTGAFGSQLGSAANVNIFNHMAKNNRGLVKSKDAVQDLMASLLGTPIALGVRWGANKLGLNPALATVGLLGPVQFFCAMKAAGSIRMEPLDRDELEQISDQFLSQGTFPEAPKPTMMGNLKSLISSREELPVSSKIEFQSGLDQVLDGNADPKALFSTFRGERYLVNLNAQSGKIHIGLRKDAQIEDVLKAYTQARALEKAQDKLVGVVKGIVGEAAAANSTVELIHRVLGQPMNAWQNLGDKGWHNNTLNLKLPTVEGEWKGDAKEPLPPFTREELLQHLEAPNEQRLRYLLGKGNNPGSTN